MCGFGSGESQESWEAERLAESPEQQEVALGEGPRQEQGVWHISGPARGPGAEHRLLRAPSPSPHRPLSQPPRSDWNT